MNIVVGQRWKTRSGRVVRVTADRHEGHSGWPGVDVWRYALDTSDIANTEGRVGLNGQDHPMDLIELIEED